MAGRAAPPAPTGATPPLGGPSTCRSSRTGPSTLAWANPPVADVPRMVTESPRDRRPVRHTPAWSGTRRGSVTADGEAAPGRRTNRGRASPSPTSTATGTSTSPSGIVDHERGQGTLASPRRSVGRRPPARQRPRLRHAARGARRSRRSRTVTPPGMSLFTFFSSGTEAIEGAMRVAHAITGRYGFISFHNDYHGRTGGAAQRQPRSALVERTCATPAATYVPSGHAYRCSFCSDWRLRHEVHPRFVGAVRRAEPAGPARRGR